jgi:NADH-quinone oxidoreductase subunit F
MFGHISAPVAEEISRALGVPLAELYGVLEFYDLFSSEPVGKQVIRVCTDPACALSGGESVLKSLAQQLQIEPGQTSADGLYTLHRAPCLGLCASAPAALVEQAGGRSNTYGLLDPAAADILQSITSAASIQPPEAPDHIGGDVRRLTSRIGRISHPISIAEYLASGGYRGLEKALSLAPRAIIEQVKAAGLVGRGGAAFPTGLKWEGAARAEGQPKYVVCNADESEPGTFKDRILMEGDPHAILEGMAIAAYAIASSRGYIYIRSEYPRAYRVMSQAIQEARQASYLGSNIMGSGFAFDVELRKGAGAYICGEETALFESIEGKRGFPRLKPPFPTTHGLFGKPTVINNVETLSNIPLILNLGVEAYRAVGTEKSPGSKLFCVSGDVTRPGLYEAPFGLTLRHLLFNLAGGVQGGKALGAVLFGGAAGAFARQEHLDTPLSFEDLRAAGLPLGSGVIMVFDETRDLRDVLLRLTRFFAHESCGKCYPCQMGTLRQYEIMQRIVAGAPLSGDDQRLSDIGWTMSDASICGLGQTAASAVLSALKLWPELFTPDAS